MKKLVNVIAVFVVTWVVLVWVIGFWNTSVYEEDEAELIYDENGDCSEFSQDLSAGKASGRTIQRAWQSYRIENTYCTRYAMLARDQQASEQFRNALKLEWDGDYIRFWNTLYGSLARHDEASLLLLRDSLKSVAVNRNLDQVEFANMVVSFVQDIPYEFVLPDPCVGNERKPCNGNIWLGIYAPAEFAYSLKGDCDTRTVLLYVILNGLGIDAVILNSYEYAHSMIGVALPFAGDYLLHRGKRFYFWETTNLGWLPGQIPPQWSNKTYWNVVLD